MVVFVLASVILMTVDHRQHHLDGLRSGLSVAMYPIQFLIDLPSTAGSWLQDTFATRRMLQEENARLHAQHLLLEARLLKFEALEAENLRLRELLSSSFKAGDRVLIAELLSVDLDPYQHKVLLNKGARHHVYTGQPLLDAQGVMGQIVDITPLTATAMLITDPAHALPVQVNRNGLRSIVVGTGSLAELSLPHIPNNADIRAGDLLVTSGLGGRFPPGYPVAEITDVTLDPGQNFAKVTARPLSHLDRSREVLLVWPPEPQLPADMPPPAQTAAPAPAADAPGAETAAQPPATDSGSVPAEPSAAPAQTTPEQPPAATTPPDTPAATPEFEE